MEVQGIVHVQIVEDQTGVKAWTDDAAGAGKLPDFKIKCTSSTTIDEVLASTRARSDEQTQKTVKSAPPASGFFLKVDLVRLTFEGVTLSKTSTLEQSGVGDGAQMSAVYQVALGAVPGGGMCCVGCCVPVGAWVRGCGTYKVGAALLEEMARAASRAESAGETTPASGEMARGISI